MPITGTISLQALLAVANTYHQPEARQQEEGQGTSWLPAHDHLETPEQAAEYLRRQGIRFGEPPQRRHLAALKEIREAGQLFATNRRAYARGLAQLLDGVRFQLDVDGGLRSVRSGWDAFIDELLVPLTELPAHAGRVKLCENNRCGWLFLDQSKNRSRQWCESASCGNRQRVRRFRRRLAA